ncbi:MAG TPA: cupin domain-containing protein [Burkholderiales bacterium]|nr:cupin domain-containing protein [Burkholderiales bacterium]
MNAPIKTAHLDTEAFHQLIHQNHMWGLWEIASQMTPQPRPEAIAYQWKWSLLKEVVKQSATAVPVGDERRAMQLFNPGLNGQWATTNTLIAAVQVLLPGEVARAHRHSPAAIRFIMQGDGAYTAVEGEKVIMHPGDFILTPSWQWHDHGNETNETVVWMDGLDVPLTKSLNAMFFEMGKELKAAHGKPANGSQALYGHGKLTPTWTKERPLFSPLMLYSWAQTLEALHDLRNHDGSPYDGISLEYTHAQTGGPVLPTMSCRVQMIRKGEKTKAKRVTGSSIFHVVQGRGRSLIDGKTFDWEKGDIIALPSWAEHNFANTGTEDAILFSISDRPVLEALGFYREALS